MKRVTSFLAVLACCAVTAFGFSETQRTIRKIVPIPDGTRLRIDHSQGNVFVSVQPGDNAVITAALRCSADTVATANRICDSIDVKVEKESGVVTIRTAYPMDTRNEHVGFRVDYVIAIPETTLLEVQNRFGEVRVSDTRNNVIIRNQNGTVRLTNSKGHHEVENAFGDVDVRAIEGDITIRSANGTVNAREISGVATISNRFGRTSVDNAAGVVIQSTGGAVYLENVSERAAHINSSFGPVSVTNVNSPVSVRNQSGNTKVFNVGSWTEVESSFGDVLLSRILEHATVSATFGSLDLREVQGALTVNAGNSPVMVQNPGGKVSVRTTGRGVVVKDAANAVKVENQNGPITLRPSAGRCWPVFLTSNFAPIRVDVPPGIGYAINAQTTFGRIDSGNIEIKGAEQHAYTAGPVPRTFYLQGQIPGGDCPLTVVNQSGNIEFTRIK